MPGSAAFIIDTAGGKLHSGQRIPWAIGEPGCALVVAESPFFSYCSFTICGGLVWQVTLTAQRVQAQCAVAQSFVRIKRGFGYTQVHLVNLSNPMMMMKGPVREIIPIGSQKVSLRLPSGKTLAGVKLLVGGPRPDFSEAAGVVEVQVPSIGLHEVVAFDLA